MSQLTIPAAFELAVQHHQSGRLQEAELIYRQILAQQPEHANALHLLGVLAYQVGKIDIAVDLMRQAIAFKPDYPEAYSNLGNALKNQGHEEEAAAACRQAIALNPNFPEAYCNLGNVLGAQGHWDEAIDAYRQAVALAPNFPEAHSNLGVVLTDKGRLDEAVAACRQAIALDPNFPEAHGNLGIALRELGHWDEAIAAYRQAIAIKPNFHQAYSNLGRALKDTGRLDEAIAACHQAIALKPNFPEAHTNLGNALSDKGHLDEAIAAHRQAIALKPGFAQAHSNLSNVLREQGRLDEALAACRQAIILNPDLPEAQRNLGAVLKDQGQLEESIAAHRQAVALNPNDAAAHSSLLYALHLHPGYDAQALYQEHVLWQQRHAQPLRKFIQPHLNDRSPDRRLRIGYVSPDLRRHPVGLFLWPLLAAHDKVDFEIFCYADVRVPDEMTERLRAQADQWRFIVGQTDEQVAARIREDRIDILVDLTMHTAGHRLLVFARKPAPVQVTYLAYCSTTGLDTIDYRLTDPTLDPAGSDTMCYSEESVRLPETYWCYTPSGETPVNALPALQRGYVTFGCLNNFCKITRPTLETWARLLHSVPDSRLILHAHPGSHRQGVLDFLGKLGIAAARCTFAGWTPAESYFQLYHDIDVALDPFPYAGGTTTCDALWMGVPVVTLAGPTAVGRSGVSILSNVGLAELVAHTTEEYINIAATLASDMPRLSALRSTLRPRMRNAPLMDGPRFAKNIEAAYRHMWRRWCAENGS